MTYLAALNTEKPMRRPGIARRWWWLLIDDEWKTDYGEGVEHCHYNGGETPWTREDYNATDWEVASV